MAESEKEQCIIDDIEMRRSRMHQAREREMENTVKYTESVDSDALEDTVVSLRKDVKDFDDRKEAEEYCKI